MKKIVVVSQDPLLTNLADRLLSPHFLTIVLGGMVSAIDSIYNDIPNLVIADIASGDDATVESINNLKEDPMFNQLPILAVIGDRPPVTQWEGLLVEDYLRKGDLERDLLSRVFLAVSRSERVVEINPLTRLPGNISINRQIEDRLSARRGLCLCLCRSGLFQAVQRQVRLQPRRRGHQDHGASHPQHRQEQAAAGELHRPHRRR